VNAIAYTGGWFDLEYGARKFALLAVQGVHFCAETIVATSLGFLFKSTVGFGLLLLRAVFAFALLHVAARVRGPLIGAVIFWPKIEFFDEQRL
jgi:hypothetical protein